MILCKPIQNPDDKTRLFTSFSGIRNGLNTVNIRYALCAIAHRLKGPEIKKTEYIAFKPANKHYTFIKNYIKPH